MVMPKPPKNFCVDSFQYKKKIGENNWSEPQYDVPVLVEHCRIDRKAEYSSSKSGKRLLYNAVIFCYEGITKPMPMFETEAVVIYDGEEHVITKVITVDEAYQKKLYSMELEVV